METVGDSNDPNQTNSPTTAPTPSNGQKSWEHAWSVEEIRKSADQWSLAADVGLLEHMKAFASRLTAQAHDVSREVSQLLHDTRLTDAKIQNVTDYFLTLSDSQFIENRVYDEDDTVSEEKDEKPAAKNKTREEREAEMVPKLKEAVKIGLDVIEEAYDVLDVAVADSDSEDEDLNTTDEVILDPKDPYVTRPLPHLIGSHQFQHEDDVGVGDLLSGDEADSVGSLSESEEEIEKPPSVSDVSSSDYDSDDETGESSASDISVQKPKASTLTSSDYTSSDDGELFASKKNQMSDDESSEEEAAAPKKKTKAVPKQSQQEEPGMFGQDDGDEDLFSGSGGLFSKPGGLFDAPKGGLFEGVDGFSDDESGSGSEKQPSKPASQPKPATKKTPAGGVSLFGGAIKKGFFEGEKDSEEEEEVEKKSVPVPPSNSGAKSFFDDESSDDDLFREKPPPIEAKSTPNAAPATQASTLFDESDDDGDNLFDQTPKKISPSKEQASSKAKPPVGGVSMFGPGGGALQKAIRNRRATSSSSSASTPKLSNPNSTSRNNESKSLFDGDSDDNLFAPPSVSSSKVTKKTKSSPQVKKKIAKSDLFGPSSDEDELFSGSSASLVKSGKSSLHSGSLKSLGSTTSKKSVLGKEKSTKKPANSLFDDLDEPLFTPKDQAPTVKNSVETKKSASNVNLFNASDSDTDLFGTSTNKSSTIIQDDSDSDDDGLFADKPPPVSSKTAKVTSTVDSLFGDSDDEVVLPSNKTSPSSKKQPSNKSAPKKSSLFDDSESEDDLFSGMSKAKLAAPANAKTSAENKTSTHKKSLGEKKAKEPATKTNNSVQKNKGLFDSESDEDLFGTKTPSRNEATEINRVENAENEDHEENIEKVEPPKKKLAGAVSMFGAGGGALLDAISKRRTESQKSNVSIKSEKSSESAKASAANQRESDEDLFGGISSETTTSSHKSPNSNVTAKPFNAATKPVAKISSSVSKVTPPVSKVTSPISKVIPPVSKVAPPVGKSSNVGKLQANLSINPGALLPGAAPTITHTRDMDAPLESVTKTRARGQAGRRPPSRRGRRAAASGGGDNDLSSVTPTESPQPAASIASATSPVLKQDDFLDDLNPTAGGQSTATSKPTKKKAAIPDLFDDDLFASTKPTKKKESRTSVDDIFSSTKSSKTSKLDTDLFGDDLSIEPDSSLFSDTKKKSKKPKLFEDDLFADLDLEPSAGKKKAEPVENGDDDLFTSKSPKPAKKKTKTNVISPLDADDLFGDSPAKTSSKKTKSSKTAKSLFDDDLFGEAPSTTKSKDKKKATADSIFDDDDLFSSATTSVKKSSSKPSKKKASNPAPASSKDDSDLFDDPLSALIGQ